MSGPDDDLERVFPGDTEMARLMRAFDWSTTPLGPPAAWPASLRTAVRIVLTSRFAMWMGWGAELTFFYNDAYGRMTLGAKHPWALGRPAREVWREIWPQIGPRIERVLMTGTATWDERLLLFLERSGFSEETYHTFSYSPLSDDERPMGMLCVVSEETERVIDERRLAALHELAAQFSSIRTTKDVLSALGRSLSRHGADFPFTLTYLVEPGSERLELAAHTGMPEGHPALAEPPWPLAEVLATGAAQVVELPADRDWPRGPWQTPPTRAYVTALTQPGQPRAAGVFVAGLNPLRPFDAAYESFAGLFVGQLAAALASASAFEQERERAEALAELDRAKTAFFSNVSHEFRTPLTLMLGPIEDALASGRALSGDELAAVHRNQLRLLKLVNSLLDFSRLEAGRSDARFERVDLALLTRDLASTFRAAVERAGIVLSVSCAPIDEPTFVDPEKWEAIVLNLLSNAFKFTFEGQIALRLDAPRPGRVRLRVEDSGVGIPEEHLPRVFERFHRVDGARARTHEGTGIGLSLVKDLVALHGGEVTVESRMGVGTTFSVELPTGSAHLPKAEVVSEPSEVAPRDLERAAAPFVTEALRWLPEPSPALGPYSGAPRDDDFAYQAQPAHVLVADDNADMRDYLRRLLSERWSVETVDDGRSALAAARARRPDLVITDVMMPSLDGFGLLAALRSDPELSTIPVIVLSARAGDEARIEGLQAGADDYLVKPFSARELLARVSTRLELLRLERQLRAERASFARLFTQTPVPIAVLRGESLVFDEANAAYLQAVGRDVIGKPLAEAIPELAEQGFIDVLRDVMATGRPHIGHEVRVQLRHGPRLQDSYWTFIYAPVRDDDGNLNRVIALCNDVTEQVVTRQRLESLAQEAARANRAKDEFLAMLGHELRNPLAPMVTALQLLRLRGFESKEQDVLERQVSHLSRLVDDLLDVSRITRGKIDLNRHRVELAEVIARAMEIASPVLEHHQHRVESHVPKHGFEIHADLDRMAQVVSNLLTNAAKYSEPRSRIEIEAEHEAGLVRLRVRDQGIGISPEMIGTVFEPFVQQEQSIERSRGGLGLGLTIVRSLVEMHGGAVGVSSEGLGCGSEFVVELPAADSTSVSRPPRSVRPFNGAARNLRVLVVDDNEDAAVMLKHALERLGYRVAVAHDGPSGLRAAEHFSPDVALLDIGLPVMDGYELAQRLQEKFDGKPLRLVAVTGYGQEADRERSVRAGFERHLVKPLDLGTVEHAIHGVDLD